MVVMVVFTQSVGRTKITKATISINRLILLIALPSDARLLRIALTSRSGYGSFTHYVSPRTEQETSHKDTGAPAIR